MEDGTDGRSGHSSITVYEDDDDDASVDNGEDRDIVLEASKIPKTPKPPWCIFRVPEVLRRHNLQAYVPDVVSIGPYHHPKYQKQRGDNHYRLMEEMKDRYLLELLSCMNIADPETLVKSVIEFSIPESEGMLGYVKRARQFYADPLDLTDEEFINMMIRDGCFIVQLFRMHHDKKLRLIPDQIFSMDCMFQYICHDLLLLENQLPWFVLESIYSFTKKRYYFYGSLSVLVLTVLSSQRQLHHNCGSYLKYHKQYKEATILHILDLMRTSIVFSLDSIPCEDSKPYHDENIQLIKSATALSDAGIKLKLAGKKDYDQLGKKYKGKGLNIMPQERKSIMNITFDRRKAVLTIPHLTIGEMTESLFRNLIALEQCCHGRSHKITSYAVLMDNLIGSRRDMEFLCEEKIIGNWLSAEDGYQFFNKLYNDTVLDTFYYDGLCAEVRASQVNWRRYREVFNRNYCSDPWKATSWVAACVLLFLTVVQTAYTFKQYYAPA